MPLEVKEFDYAEFRKGLDFFSREDTWLVCREGCKGGGGGPPDCVRDLDAKTIKPEEDLRATQGSTIKFAWSHRIVVRLRWTPAFFLKLRLSACKPNLNICDCKKSKARGLYDEGYHNVSKGEG